MATQIGNGAKFNWDSVEVGEVRSISLTQSAEGVDVTDLADTQKYIEGGLPDYELSVDIVGTSDIDVGDIELAEIVWSGGSAIPLAGAQAFVCVENSVKGEVDGAVISTLRFKPSAIAAS